MTRRIGALALLLVLAACSVQKPNAAPEEIAAVSFRDPGTSYLTLYTMVNNRTGAGGHSSLMINAGERVIFDPAGSFYADIVPERNDVLFGITPAVERAYRGAHARSTFRVVRQKIEVTPAQAELAYRLALQAGPVPGSFCARATAGILQQIQGLESINVVFQPTKLMDQFGEFPGVVTDVHYEDDDEDLRRGLEQSNDALNQAG